MKFIYSNNFSNLDTFGIAIVAIEQGMSYYKKVLPSFNLTNINFLRFFWVVPSTTKDFINTFLSFTGNFKCAFVTFTKEFAGFY